MCYDYSIGILAYVSGSELHYLLNPQRMKAFATILLFIQSLFFCHTFNNSFLSPCVSYTFLYLSFSLPVCGCLFSGTCTVSCDRLFKCHRC